MRKPLVMLMTCGFLALAGCAGGMGGQAASELAAFPGAEA